MSYIATPLPTKKYKKYFYILFLTKYKDMNGTLEIQFSAEDDEFLLLAFLLFAVEVVRPEQGQSNLIKGGFSRFFQYFIQHCFICRPVLWIRMLLDLPNPDSSSFCMGRTGSLHQQAKKVRETLISTL